MAFSKVHIVYGLLHADNDKLAAIDETDADTLAAAIHAITNGVDPAKIQISITNLDKRFGMAVILKDVT